MPGLARAAREGAAAVRRARLSAFVLSLAAASTGFLLFLQFGRADGLDGLDILRSLLILLSTFWLAWGAALGLLGLTTRPVPPTLSETPIRGRTVVLVPVYNEDPVTTFARIAAMDASLQICGTGAIFHFAILSDTRSEAIAARERLWFLKLIGDRDAAGRVFYRRRADNTGRKAGNVEDFIQRSGGAYDYALILDADSLMEGATIVEMVRRMEAQPDLGLLQSLPRVINARSRFGRAMQFAASFYSPVFARGLAMMQGRTGPFWGHNALVRIRAFAASCGLPELRGQPPFGGHILSHDYVEAALLARSGWAVRLDDDLGGSYEEGPENLIDHARRDRRWCQGNLQHSRLLTAPGLKGWSRWTFLQGIIAYIAPLFWLAFILASIAAQFLAVPPDYFPQDNWPFPVFPVDEKAKAIGLAVGIFGLLLLPKILIALDAAASGRARGFGGAVRAIASTFAELALSSLLAPIFLMFQTRSVFQVLTGRDGGWPANNRGDGRLTIAEAWGASGWISLTGVLGLGLVHALAPGLVLWLLPVALPMIAAPVLISWCSQESRSGLMTVPAELHPPGVVTLHADILRRWLGDGGAGPSLGGRRWNWLHPAMPDPSASRRDARLDVFRGLALVMIYINHVPGTVYEHLTTRNFGLSDAAEAFVLMSGVAAGLAYGPAFRAPPFWPGVARVWHRVWTLYLVHLLMTVWALGIAAGAALWLGSTRSISVNEIDKLFEMPLGFLVGVPLLTHQIGYVNILPMYAVLLAAAPAMLWLGLRRPRSLVALSAALWLATGWFEWNLPASPNPGGWFFNPLAWQLVFVIGLLVGIAHRKGERLVPVRRAFQIAAAAILAVGLVWTVVPGIGDWINHQLWAANQNGLHRFFAYPDKTYLTWHRLLHILALAYLLSSLDLVRRWAASPAAMPLAMLGRHALPVFALGSLLALSAQAVKSVAEPGFLIDSALILSGLGAQYALALSRDRFSIRAR